MTSKGYQRLERTIERAEQRKGYSTQRASYIAHSAAGKVAREKRARRNPPAVGSPTRYRGVLIRHDAPRTYLAHWNPGHELRGTNLAAVKAQIDRLRDAGRSVYDTKRRNPRPKAGPSHDLFGERTHQAGLFGGKVYAAKPAPKKTAAEKKREAKRNAGQTSFDLGLTRGLFG